MAVTDVDSGAPPAEEAAAAEHQYRYPGSPPFRDTDVDRRLFRGRDAERDVVLHSILSSGPVPALRGVGFGEVVTAERRCRR